MTYMALDEGSTWSVERWTAWITARLEEREQVYAASPIELIAAHCREATYTRDYHGRELLELLQNADDAGDEGRVQAFISLTPHGLCIANTGSPFPAAGVESLMVSDVSPKLLDRRRYIGSKGLGFRSILNWTSCPFILSGNLSLGFNRSRAAAWLDHLCAAHPNIRDRVAQERAVRSVDRVIPILAVPFLLDSSGVATGISPSNAIHPAIWHRAHELRADGYITVIGIPFEHPDTMASVKEQLAHLGRDVLLFTRHLDRLIVEQNGMVSTWKVERGDDLITVAVDGSPDEYWQLFTQQGQLPQSVITKDDLLQKYEIKLAVPLDDGVALSYKLFNYFPTQVRFPYRVIVHITMQLNTNRQNIVNSPANGFLASQLATLLAKAAEECNDAGPWQPLSMVSAAGDVDPVLSDLQFPEKLLAEASKRKLIPLRTGQMVVPAEARRLEKDATAWLPEEGFTDLAPIPFR